MADMCSIEYEQTGYIGFGNGVILARKTEVLPVPCSVGNFEVTARDNRPHISARGSADFHVTQHPDGSTTASCDYSGATSQTIRAVLV